MIKMTYSCKCGWESGVLDEAQQHANHNKEHIVDIRGTITFQDKCKADKEFIEQEMRKRATDAEIMRRAREKGFIPQKRTYHRKIV